MIKALALHLGSIRMGADFLELSHLSSRWYERVQSGTLLFFLSKLRVEKRSREHAVLVNVIELGIRHARSLTNTPLHRMLQCTWVPCRPQGANPGQTQNSSSREPYMCQGLC